jgi:hypothetical protein
LARLSPDDLKAKDIMNCKRFCKAAEGTFSIPMDDQFLEQHGERLLRSLKKIPDHHPDWDNCPNNKIAAETACSIF